MRVCSAACRILIYRELLFGRRATRFRFAISPGDVQEAVRSRAETILISVNDSASIILIFTSRNWENSNEMKTMKTTKQLMRRLVAAERRFLYRGRLNRSPFQRRIQARGDGDRDGDPALSRVVDSIREGRTGVPEPSRCRDEPDSESRTDSGSVGSHTTGG